MGYPPQMPAQYGAPYAPYSPTMPVPAPGPMPSLGANGQAGVVSLNGNALGYKPMIPFGPQVYFDANIDDGLGYRDGSYRVNALLPHHLVANQSITFLDLAAAVTSEGEGAFNFGGGYRYYDRNRNRVTGVNAYFDLDSANGYNNYRRIGLGYESLGKYLDFRANGYAIAGSDSSLISSREIDNCTLVGNSILITTEETRESAFSGVDLEAGGPLPFLGRYGLNGYAGGYYLKSGDSDDTLGYSLRGEALITDGLTANLTHTNDDTLGRNTWAGFTVSLTNWRQRRFLKPRIVRQRLADPVRRSSRIHTNIDTQLVTTEAVNAATGSAYSIVYVDPNLLTSGGTGTVEDPFSSLDLVVNDPGIDIISIDPRLDDTSTNLMVSGGISLFDNQALIGRSTPYEVFTSGSGTCTLPARLADDGSTLPGPIIMDPTIGAGGSVIRLANNNTVAGLTIDASNADGTVFGTGISNPLPIVDFNISGNTFQNYTNAVQLTDVSGTAVFNDNTLNGLEDTSMRGFSVTTLNNSDVELSMQRNTATNNAVVGLEVIAGPGSSIRANNPDGFADGTPGTVLSTGIVGNTSSNNGIGINVLANTGSRVNAVVDNNETSDNTEDGLKITSDGATVILPSVAGNTALNNGANGLFIRYTNGGQVFARTEDRNQDGLLSPTEDWNGNGILDPGEDLNGNGILDLTEDSNNNGRLDAGIVSNTFSSNGIAGICIFGDGSGEGFFDIGGPQAELGNSLFSNTEAGLLVDLTGTAVGQFDTMNNLIGGGSGTGVGDALTIVLDFWEPGQGALVDPLFNFDIDPFDVTNYGFAATDFDLVTNAVLDTIRGHYHDIPTVGQNGLSPIPDGQALAIDFVIGDLGIAPSNGAAEYYTLVLGDTTANTGGVLGVAFGNSVRDANGNGPNGNGIFNGGLGEQFSQVYTNVISTLPGLTPANALTSGNLEFTRQAIAGTTSHEIGHGLSLLHLDANGAITPTGAAPIMGTGAIDLPLQQRILPREFAFSGTNAQAGGATQTHVQQLVDAVGLRDALTPGGETREGISISASGAAVVQPSTFINNTISTTTRDGIAVNAFDNAVVQGTTIQGNTIQNNGRDGIRLTANGANALIEASNTIGGNGLNLIGGVEFAQANTITGNNGNGITALATNNGTINGNAIANTITGNGGNGIALLIDPSGTINFGDLSQNRLISENVITGNGQAGILLRSNVSPSTVATMDAIIVNNEISNNAGGGLIIEQTGVNNIAPFPPVITNNNTMNVTVGGSGTTDGNIFDGNGGAGIASIVSGTAKQDITIEGNTVTNTSTGTDPRFDGDGIYIGRNGSSLITANILNNISSNNAGEGLDVVAQGNSQFDSNQPMSGMPNLITFNDNTFDSNAGNGARFRLFGDAVLIGDGACNLITNNGLDGINVTTTQSSTFGDATDATLLPGDPGYIAPLGRRSVFNGNIITGNTDDGVEITANDSSSALVEITSRLKAGAGTAASAHNPAFQPGDTSISNNGDNGVEINSNGGQSDVLISATDGTTLISGNAVDGVQITASGTSQLTTTVSNSDIINNGDDGIDFNSLNSAQPTLNVGGVGQGNRIQGNGDDGLAITATGNLGFGPAAEFGISRPVVTVVDNVIGGSRDGVDAGNGGDGVDIQVNGGVSTLTANAFASGPVLTATFSNNEISNNAGRGANIRLTGATGTRFRANGANTVFDPTTITFNQNNTISSNGLEGIFYEADPGYIQNRAVLLGNTGFPGDDRLPGFDANFAVDPNGSQAFYDPSLPQFTNLNLGTLNGNASYQAPYLNIETDNNSFLTVVDNTIQNNGAGQGQGEGLFIRVGTNAYVAADVRNNGFGGNLDADFRTESFLTGGLNTNDFIDTNGVGTFDTVFLDDTAQLDLRFNNNFGNQIAVVADGATYTNPDRAKLFPNSLTFDPAIAPTTRDAFLFQVDGGPFLDNPNNQFIQQGQTADIDAQFSSGNYFLRSISDPLFPNIGFAPPLP